MAYDIRYAGLDEGIQRRLIQATNLIYSSYNKVTATAWDQSDCDLLVTDPSDADGKAALRDAESRQLPVLLVADTGEYSHRCVPRSVKAGDLTEIIRASLGQSGYRSSRRASALVRLATESGLAGQDVDATLRNRWLALRPSSGRVFAYSQAELRTLAGQLIETEWSFGRAGSIDVSRLGPLASMSIEAFYLLAADANKDSLPSVPNDDLRLYRRPNLDEASALAYPVTVTHALQQQAQTPGAVAINHGLSPADVTACLWAFRAAGVAVPVNELNGESGSRGLFNQIVGSFRRDRGRSVAS